jgi:hypothetical protein
MELSFFTLAAPNKSGLKNVIPEIAESGKEYYHCKTDNIIIGLHRSLFKYFISRISGKRVLNL